MSGPIRAGLIGLSWISIDHAGPASDPVLGTATPYSHCSAIAAEGGIEIVAGADPRVESHDEYRSKWGDRWPDTRLYTDAQEMLEKEQLDLVCIVTPDHLHAGYMLSAMDRGARMIFCEKPLATDLDEADAVIAKADEVGATILVNHTRRWARVEVAARNLAAGGSLGPVSQVIIDAGGQRAMLFRNLSHAVDLTVFLSGDPDPVWVAAELEAGSEDYGTSYAGDGGRDPMTDPGANIQVGFANGARAYIAGLKSGPGDRAIQILCPEGRITIDTLGARVVRTSRTNDGTPNSKVTQTITPLGGAATVEGMQAAIRDLIAAHREGRESSSSARSARRTVAIMEAVLRSQAAGSVRVPLR